MNINRDRLRPLPFHHSVLNQLGIAGDGGQRRLQLVGDVGREILTHLRALEDPVVLRADRLEKRTELRVVRDILDRRIIHVGHDPDDRGHNLTAQKMREQNRRRHEQNENQQNHRHRTEKQGSQTPGVLRDPKHRAVRHPQGEVVGADAQRVRTADGLSFAVGERLLHLGPVGMVLHRRRIRLVVEKNRAVRRDPCDPLLHADVPEIADAGVLEILQFLQKKRGLPHIIADLYTKQVIVYAGHRNGCDQNRDDGESDDSGIDSPVHWQTYPTPRTVLI